MSLCRLVLQLCCVFVAVNTAKAAPLAPVSAPGPDNATGQTAVKALVNAIRYGKDDVACKKLGLRSMAASLMGPTWTQMSAEEKTHLVTGLEKLLRATSFPRGRQMFAYLDAILFKAPIREGDRMHLPCTIVVHRELKKVELPVEWVLGQEDGSWKVVDIVSQNESTCAGIRNEEVLPLLQEGGVAKLLETLDARVAKVAGSNAGAEKTKP